MKFKVIRIGCTTTKGRHGPILRYIIKTKTEKVMIRDFKIKMYVSGCHSQKFVITHQYTQCLGMKYYVNFLGGIGSNGFHIK